MPKYRLWIVFVAAAAAIGLIAALFPGRLSRNGNGTVVVYASVDSEYAEPVARAFETETGLRVVLRTDSEASKTVGLVNRLIEMKDRPDGDVFWNGEAAHSAKLARMGVLTPYRSPAAADIPEEFKDPGGAFAGFGCRARVIVYNKRLPPEDIPKSVLEMADPKWKGRICMARPVLGTTKSHMVALWLKLGDEKARAFFSALKANQAALLPGNATVRDRVGDGTYDAGLTDTDDVYSGMARGLPIGMAIPDQEEGGLGVYMIPNTVGIIAGGPNPEGGRRFVDFLLSTNTEKFLAERGARQTPVRESISVPDGVISISKVRRMNVPISEVSARLDELSAQIDLLLR